MVMLFQRNYIITYKTVYIYEEAFAMWVFGTYLMLLYGYKHT